MEFEYTNNKRPDSDCVAVLDTDSEGLQVITIKTDQGCTFFYSNDTPNHGNKEDWENELASVGNKFYSGDTLTITF